MDNYFRNMSAFSFLEREVPDCFKQVEAHLAPQIPRGRHPGMYQPVALAENLCRRLSDVELYMSELQALASTLDANNPVLISSRLVGYFGSFKAVLDAGA